MTESGPQTRVTSGTTPGRDVSSPAPQDQTRLSLGPELPGLKPDLDGTVGSLHDALQAGHGFGPRYSILSLVGAGGMGAVYRAWDQELGVCVALKVIRPEVMSDADAARSLERRFKQELLLARQVTHRNVVRIHDLGDVNGIKYLTMPFIEGEDLAAILKREHSLPVPRALSIARGLVSGLAAAHQAGIVHRDLKPANVMVDREGEPLIMDFGVARSAGVPTASLPPPSAPVRTSRGAASDTDSMVGTVEYMAPEQARGEPVDRRADIYAFGLILYDMLVGRLRAERAGSLLADLTTRIQQAPPALCQVNPSIPEALDRIVTRCVQPDPAARFQTTSELAAAIDALDDNGRPRPIPRMLTPRLAAAVGGIFAGVVGLTWWFAPGRAPVGQPAPISVLVADFDNRTSDPVFSGALEQALSISIEGASFITAFPRPKAVEIAEQNVGRGRALTEDVARLVARREMIEVVLAGDIQATDGRYTVTLRALNGSADPNQTETLARARAVATNKSDVLAALNRASADLRAQLGDTAEETVRLQAADVFTARSMEALKTYAQAQDLQARGRKPDALAAFQRAIEQDQEFALAYSGAAVMSWETGRTREAHEFWRKMLTLMNRMTERERYRALGTYYLGEAANYEKAVENYTAMVQRYPADRYARSNLALAHFFTLNMPKALEEGRRATDLDPRNVLIRSNYALYAMYAGDFTTAVKEARAVIQQDPNAYVVVKQGYLPLAVAAIVQGDLAGAENVYARMGQTGPAGASLARMGLADMALYQGRHRDAEVILKQGIADDLRRGDTETASEKYVALAETYAATGRPDLGTRALVDARRLGRGRLEVEVPAAALFIRWNRPADAEAVAAHLVRQLQPQVRAYGNIIRADIALAEERLGDAADALTAATKLANLWLARFQLGVAYVEAEHYAEAMAELDMCRKRRGEAVAIFLNEVPTCRYLAPLTYWLGRAYEGMGEAGAARAEYERYVALRSRADSVDPLLEDVRARLKAVGP